MSDESRQQAKEGAGDVGGGNSSSSVPVGVRLKGAACAEDGDNLLVGDCWRIVQRFASTFLAVPVFGIFGGHDKAGIKTLALALIERSARSEWDLFVGPVESLSVVWPLLLQVSDDLNGDYDLARAIGELLLFGLDSERRMEVLWWDLASDAQKQFEKQWTDTDRQKHVAWESSVGAAPAPSVLIARPLSQERAMMQQEERRSGRIFPSLLPVRPYTLDSVARRLRQIKAMQKQQKVRAATAVRAKAARTKARTPS